MICGPASSFCLLPSIESLLQIPHNVLMSYLTYNICRTIFIGNQAGGRDISKDIAAMAKEVRVASISRYGKSADSSHYRLYVYAETVVHCIGHVTVEDNQCVRPLYEQVFPPNIGCDW
ncbi:hypothetical protein DY000_02054771 [Brassica cretica]|uniref:Uncharacterized protein n=1 Tax=Brassica cretica TaxID=69181 RepID=A0ABQ7AEH0_BRACR|nr:hypothetical protein DY000_02054771 [Brassica cretica]